MPRPIRLTMWHTTLYSRRNIATTCCARAAERLKTLLLQAASHLGIIIQAMEVMPDHVHLFIIARPTISIPQIVQYLKGYSSYFMRKEFTYLRRYPSLWTRSYFVETVGHISEKTVVHYIENQKK